MIITITIITSVTAVTKSADRALREAAQDSSTPLSAEVQGTRVNVTSRTLARKSSLYLRRFLGQSQYFQKHFTGFQLHRTINIKVVILKLFTPVRTG
jgi:hypothetical protein